MNPHASTSLADRLENAVRASPRLMRVLDAARDFDLPDWRIVSGAVYQTVWNALTGRAPDHGIKDFDLFYFDASDLSYEAEDLVIRRTASLYPPDLAGRVEVRNQARVHLWFEQRFGEAYAPLACTDEALTRFVSPAFSVGVRLEPDDRLAVAAPFGLEDLFAMRLRPNPLKPLAKDWSAIVAGVQARWPDVMIETPPTQDQVG